MNQTTSEKAIVCWILPVALWVITWLGGGFHYETNDDLLMSFMARGIAFGQPSEDFSLYFHGFSQLFVWLYQQFSAVPWYGLILYFLLFICTQLAFGFLYKMLRAKVSFKVLIGVILLFFLAGWYEHLFWFNYMRVPFLLAGLVCLHLFTHPNSTFRSWKSIGLVILFFLALGIRPGAAILGALITLPAFLPPEFSRAKWKHFFTKVSPLILVGLAFFVLIQGFSSEKATVYRKLDTLKSGVLDYQWCCGKQKTVDDNYLVAGLNHWFVADTKVWTSFLAKENVYPDWSYFRKEAVPEKLSLALKALVFDQFLILFLIVGLLWLLFKDRQTINFRKVIFFQIYFWLLIFSFAIFLKLPPRVLTPALSLLFLVIVSFLPKPVFPLKKIPLVFTIMLVLLVGVQLYKISNRIQWQENQQQKAETFIHEMQAGQEDKILITADFGGELRSLSPFKNYGFGSNKLLMLTGWQTLDPHFKAYCQQLSGSPDVIETIKYLSKSDQAVWIITPTFREFLMQYLDHFYEEPAGIRTLKDAKMLDNGFHIYTSRQ